MIVARQKDLPAASGGTGGMDDDSLASRAASGEGEALAGLVQRHGRAVLDLACRICGDRHQGEHVAREAFASLVGEGGTASVEWRLRSAVVGMAMAETPEPAPTRQEQSQSVGPCLSGQPPQVRTAVVLRDRENLSYEEISSLMGATRAEVSRWISTGRRALVEQLAPTPNPRPSV